MEGIEILNRTMVTELIPLLVGLGITLVIVGGCTFLMGWNDGFDYDWLNVIAVIGGAVIFLAGVACAAYEKDTGRYEYKAIIDESVSMTDVHEKYKVMGQEGKIWILEDKEKN